MISYKLSKAIIPVTIFPFCIFGGASLAADSLPAYAVSHAVVLVDDMTYSFPRIFKSGENDRYKLTFHANFDNPQAGGKPTEFLLNVTLKESSKDVKEDGSASIIDVLEEGVAKFGDQELNAPQALITFTQKRDKLGHLTDIKLDAGDDPLSQGIATILQQVLEVQSEFYPGKAVKIGDKWSVNPQEIKIKDQTITTTSNASVIGKERIGDVDTIKIKLNRETTVKGPKGSKANFEGFGYIDPKDGKFRRITGKIEGSGGVIKKGDFTYDRDLGQPVPAVK